MVNKLNYFKSFLIVFSVLISGLYSFALDFDLSVDEEIRKNYNPSKLELENLPPLPKVQSSNSGGKNQNYKNVKPANSLPQLLEPEKQPVISQVNRSNAVKIPYGTKFKVKSLQGLSDSLREGTRISFSSLQPVTKTYFVIPQGTVFRGTVVDSHNPQISGNGGLLVLKIDCMNYKGRDISLDAKITKVNHKKVFINNIKGKRQYLKNVANQIDKGDKFYKKSRRASAKLSSNPIGTIISPIPTIVGMGTYAVNLVGSPLIGLFGKGGKLSIPAGTQFEIKLTEEAYIPR